MKSIRNAMGLGLLLLAAWSGYGSGAHAEQNRGLEIARLVDQRNSGFATELSDAELTLVDAHGKQVSRQLQTRTIEVEGDGDRSIVTFIAPADIKGTKLLTWAHAAGSDDQWLFLPALKRVKRISSSNKTGSFMGSEFSYEDLSSTEVGSFTYEFVDETTFEGANVWRYLRYPTDENSGYRKQVVWVAKDLMQPVKIEYFNRRDELTKVAHYAGFKKYGQYFRPTVVQMANVTSGKRSIIKWHSRNLGAPVPSEAFRPEAL